jgi:hypothetical protein
MTFTKQEKKILIVSESNNNIIKRILLWLINCEYEIVLLNAESDNFSLVSLDLNNSGFMFKINQRTFNSEHFKTIYFYQGALQLEDITGIRAFNHEVKDFKTAFDYYRTAYEVSLRELVHDLMHNANTIGRDNGGRINKIRMLEIAKRSGLEIPKTLLTKNKTDLRGFLRDTSSVITKSLDLNLFFFDSNRDTLVHGLTTAITYEDLEKIPEEFPLTVFQENIKKLIELRVFFIGEENFASAIFSQSSKNTEQDYRNYNNEKPNRIVPFKLPDDVNQLINKFKKYTRIKTGSIDLILTTENKYYFLEINPQGQFFGVSEACNYYLEKKIADYLQC